MTRTAVIIVLNGKASAQAGEASCDFFRGRGSDSTGEPCRGRIQGSVKSDAQAGNLLQWASVSCRTHIYIHIHIDIYIYVTYVHVLMCALLNTVYIHFLPGTFLILPLKLLDCFLQSAPHTLWEASLQGRWPASACTKEARFCGDRVFMPLKVALTILTDLAC